MRKMFWLVLPAVLVIVAGCGKSDATKDSASANSVSSATGGTAQSIAKLEGPAAAAYEFLEAVRTGNDEKARSLLSSVAREKTAALNRSVTPAASDTATFTVGKVEYVNQDGARVACTWTDLGENNQRVNDEAIWVLRLEDAGWRIAGVAAQVVPGEPPLLLNFEDPDDMLRKKQWADEEVAKRSESPESDAKSAENSEKSLRR
jgi:hypothetical protein